MIPEYKEKIVEYLDLKSVKIPPEKFLSDNEGNHFGNQSYFDPRSRGWADYESIIPEEKKAIKAAARKAKTASQFVALMQKAEDKAIEKNGLNIPADLGVAGLVCALVELGYEQKENQHASYGCVPFTSSRGSTRLTRKKDDVDLNFPHVDGFITKEVGAKLLETVKMFNKSQKKYKVGLDSMIFPEGYPGFELYARKLDALIGFAEFLYRNRDVPK